MIAASEYVRRRRQLMEMAGPDAAVVVPAAPARIRNNDAHYPYRQDSDLLYLTGFEEPEAVLVLVPGREAAASILFCRERDLKREIWDGPRLGPEAAPEALRRLHARDPSPRHLVAFAELAVRRWPERSARRTAATARKFLADGKPPRGLY